MTCPYGHWIYPLEVPRPLALALAVFAGCTAWDPPVARRELPADATPRAADLCLDDALDPLARSHHVSLRTSSTDM
jgi:hypothetical protein